jgi:hypothetical protein
MARRRKTIEIETIKRMMNARIANPAIDILARKALASMLEAILFEANAYQGFNYIHWTDEGGYRAWVEAGRPEGSEKNQYIYGPGGVDDGRVRYY